MTAPAYMVQKPDRDRMLWSRYALLRAVEVCLRPGPIDWPHGWARLMPGAAVQFVPGGFPWSGPERYTAAPVTDPGDFGTPCADCHHYASDHTPGYPWARYRRDKQVCTQWRAHPTH